jgi:hypothetical protein
VDDDDELDENDPALEELGLSLAPKSHKEKKKVKSLSTYNCTFTSSNAEEALPMTYHGSSLPSFFAPQPCSKGEKAK